ncbi:thiamine phosphate synthase [Fructobacillus broussonetiae]|uniref:thiamine phosphate synthase n=1 Tax=Fructobacillus broussonetiae TaxID=2713173 RepID=UPI003083A71B
MRTGFGLEVLGPQLVIETENISGSPRALANLVKSACRSGVKVVQLREKDETKLNWEDKVVLAKALKQICSDNHSLFFIDDDLDLAILSHADGIHVGQSDTSVEHIVQQAPNLLIGLSISTMEEFKKSEHLFQHLAYIGVGPVFATQTKKDAKLPIGLDGLKAIKAKSPVPVIGIGGVSEETASRILDAGADGVAAISAFTKSNNLYKTVFELSKKE